MVTTETTNDFAKVGELLRFYTGEVYQTDYGRIDFGYQPTWTVLEVTKYGSSFEAADTDFVLCARNKKDGTAGKTQRYFLVTKGGSVRPASTKDWA